MASAGRGDWHGMESLGHGTSMAGVGVGVAIAGISKAVAMMISTWKKEAYLIKVRYQVNSGYI